VRAEPLLSESLRLKITGNALKGLQFLTTTLWLLISLLSVYTAYLHLLHYINQRPFPLPHHGPSSHQTTNSTKPCAPISPPNSTAGVSPAQLQTQSSQMTSPTHLPHTCSLVWMTQQKWPSEPKPLPPSWNLRSQSTCTALLHSGMDWPLRKDRKYGC